MAGEQAGRVAIVTGASYGLGRAIVEDLCKRGAKVMMTDVTDRVAGTCEELAAIGCEVAHAYMDVTDKASVSAVVAETVNRFGRLDVFVNNAGWSKKMNLIRDITVEEWQTYMDINVRGNLHCIQVAADAMIAAGNGGRFIAIGSTAAVKPYLRAASYCTSKSAIHMLIKSAALEFGQDGITFNVVSPGPSTTETNLAHGAGAIDPAMGEAKRAREARIPLGKNDPEDIATAVAYFASPEARRVTGQMLVVEGGGAAFVVNGNAQLKRLFGLDGQVALVTGAAVGIGKATAQLLADAGARVVIADKDLAGAEAVAASLEAATAIGFDLADNASIEALLTTIEERFGRLDILVNNAAIFPKYAFGELAENHWKEMQQVNVWGCFAVMRAAAALMRKGERGGAIITVSSVGSSRTAVHNQIAYNASKAAIDSMTISAAYDLAPDNIRVNSIQPGAIRPLEPQLRKAEHIAPTGPLMAPGRILLGRPGLAEEVAGPILMLAGAAGAYITGQAIVVDGGFFIS